MQLALRASLAAAVVPARVKLGFDRARAREAQWLFTTHRIEARSREHVLDSLFGFTERLGIRGRSMRWDIPLPLAAMDHAQRVVPDGQPTLVLSPCSSHALRNWSAERYAALADHAAARHGLRVLVCGGRSELELQYGTRIGQLMRHPCVNLVGKDTLLELLATLSRATVLVSPDSGSGAHGDSRRHAGDRALCDREPGPQRSRTSVANRALIATRTRHCASSASPPARSPGRPRSSGPG